nr:MAG TPA: hypothetical protein [Caudoviricetes sp.]
MAIGGGRGVICHRPQMPPITPPAGRLLHVHNHQWKAADRRMHSRNFLPLASRPGRL